MRSKLPSLTILCLFCGFAPAQEVAVESTVLGKSRTFLFTYVGTVKELKPGQEANIWLPVPGTTQEQEVEVVAKKLIMDGTFHVEKEYGNQALFFVGRANERGQIPFEISYRVTRKEVKTDLRQPHLKAACH